MKELLPAPTPPATSEPHGLLVCFFSVWRQHTLHSNAAASLDKRLPSTSEDEASFAPERTSLKKNAAFQIQIICTAAAAAHEQ